MHQGSDPDGDSDDENAAWPRFREVDAADDDDADDSCTSLNPAKAAHETQDTDNFLVTVV
jgi:hypothetical protein